MTDIPDAKKAAMAKDSNASAPSPTWLRRRDITLQEPPSTLCPPTSSSSTMARRKTPKVQKASYTERVLGAMTQIQKEHRKHSIHTATLRAQIRKNAEAKRDTLGPNWSLWVTKAIQKLTEDGVIEHPNAQEVAFTSTGKEIITTAKKALPDEDHLWRHISTNISRGRKRRRSSLGAAQDAGTSISAKRARRSVASEVVGSIHMTPIRSPRKSLGASTPRTPAQVTFRDMSPLTDISEDNDDHNRENTSLKVQLREKEKEIEELRNRLNTLERSARPTLTESTSRHGTPANLNFDASEMNPLYTPTRPGTVSTTTRLQVPKGITRTQSGTYIPNMSKQPTPAPSDVEEDGEVGLLWGVDENALNPESLLAPSRSASRTLADVEGGPRVGAGLPSPPTTDEGRAVFVARVEDLEQLLKTKEVALSELQISKDGLDAQKASLQQEIATLQNRLREETARLEQAQADVQAQTDENATLKYAIDSLQEERDLVHKRLISERENHLELEIKTAEVEGELAACRAELATAMNKIEDMVAETVQKDATMVKLEASLATAKDEVASSHAQLRHLEDSLKDLQADNDAEKEVYKKIHLQLDERTKQVEGLELDLLREKEIRESLEKSLSSTTERLASVESDLLVVQRSADEKDEALGQTTRKLSELEEAKAKLEDEIERLQREVGSVQQAWSDSQEVVEQANRDLAAKESMLEDLSAKLADAELRVAAAEKSRIVENERAEEAQQELTRKILTLEEQALAKQTEIDALRSKLADLEMELDAERAALVGVRADALRTSVELEAERSHSAVLEGDKIHAEQRVRSLEEELVVLKEESARNTVKFNELKVWVEQYRRSQTTSLDALVEKVGSLESVQAQASLTDQRSREVQV